MLTVWFQRWPKERTDNFCRKEKLYDQVLVYRRIRLFSQVIAPPMTINQAIRILDPETTAEELATIEYYGGLHGREKMVAACDEACRMAVQIMRKYMEEQK